MERKQKSPVQRIIRTAVPYIILFGIVLLIFAIGFAVGCIVKNCPKDCDKAKITSSVPYDDTLKDKPIVEPTTTEPEVEWVEYIATAYCPCKKCCGIWATKRPLDEDGNPIVYGATDIVLKQGVSIAADTKIHPIGTMLEIEGLGTYIVQDRGSQITDNRLDIYFDNHDDALEFGVQTVRVRVQK